MKRLLVVAGLVVVLAGAVACDQQTAGTPTGALGTSAAQMTGASGSADGAPTALPVDQPCSLLSSADLQQLGASTPASQDVTGGSQTCEVAVPNGSVTIGFPDYGLSSLVVTGPVTDLPIGRHQAKKMTPTADPMSCYVAIGITPTQRLDLSVETYNGAQPCPLAMSAAQLVEPKLPVSG